MRITQVVVRPLLSPTTVLVLTRKLSTRLIIRKDILQDLRGTPSIINKLIRTLKKPR
jgi:hypothetical protein